MSIFDKKKGSSMIFLEEYQFPFKLMKIRKKRARSRITPRPSHRSPLRPNKLPLGVPFLGISFETRHLPQRFTHLWQALPTLLPFLAVITNATPVL
jgi:hypothetical protein